MQLERVNPLTGGMMVIIMPGRKGAWLKGQDKNDRQFQQQTTQQIVNLSDDVIRFWAHKPLKDEIEYRRQADGSFRETTVLKHNYTKRLAHWLEEHFLTIIGQHCLLQESCSWTFQHNKA